MKYFVDSNNKLLIRNITLSFLVAIPCVFLNVWIALILLYFLIVGSVYLWVRKREEKIERLTHYLQQLNSGDYHHDINAYEEGELAKLHAELNRTTINVRTMNENLIHQKASLKQAMEDISHQLKTPLASLQILNELQNQSDELVAKSNEQIKRLHYLTQSLLKLIKLESNTELFKIKQGSIKTCVQECLNILDPILEEKGIKVMLDLNVTDAYFDEAYTLDAISNILVNKVRYAQSQILIKSENRGYTTLLRISDDGPEISVKDRIRVFDRFYSGANRSPDSIGIGLSIAKEIMLQQNGNLVVENENTFVFTFNRYQ